MSRIRKIIVRACGLVLISTGIAFAQSTPSLTVNELVSPTIAPGSQNAAVALFTFMPSGGDVRITSIPVNVSFTGPSNLTGCQVRNLTNIGVPLNTGANAVASLGSGTNTITLDAPFTLGSGTAATLVLTCNVSQNAAPGGAVTFTLAPASVTASNASTGAAITPVAGPGLTGGTLMLTSSATGPGTTPGAPSTGEGGDAFPTAALLLLSALMGAGGVGYLLKRTLETT